MKIQNQEFAFSALNANDIERVAPAYGQFQKASEELSAQAAQMSAPDALRAQCRIVMQFINDIFGADASERLGLDENDLGKALQVVQEATSAIYAEKNLVQQPVQPEPRSAVPFPDPKAQMSATIATPKAPAAEMVARVDKQARRRQLLKELAALEND